MSKIISLIASYSPSNQYVSTVITELNKISDVILFTTEPHTYNVAETVYFNKSISHDLVFEPRKWILNNLYTDWDYILYNEDDILIPTKSIQAVIDLYNTLPENMIPGFARYEVLEDNIKRYIDLHPKHSVHRGGNTIIKQVFQEYDVWEPWNLHSGNFLLSKKDVIRLNEQGKFSTNFLPFNTYGSLETAASDVYRDYYKVLSKNIESVSCYHLPNKYIPLQGGPTISEIISEYNK